MFFSKSPEPYSSSSAPYYVVIVAGFMALVIAPGPTLGLAAALAAVNALLDNADLPYHDRGTPRSNIFPGPFSR